MNRLAVRIALASVVIVVLVGALVMTLLTEEIKRQTDDRFAARVLRARGQVDFQVRSDGEFRAIAASVLAGQPNFVAALQRRDDAEAIAVAREFFIRSRSTFEGSSGVRLYDANGVLIGPFDAPDAPRPTQPVPEALHAIERALPTALVRRDERLGLSVSGIAPVFGAERRIIGAVEALTALDDGYAAAQARLLDVSVTIIDGDSLVGASSAAVRFDPAEVAEVRSTAAQQPVYVQGPSTRYLSSAVTLRGHDGQMLGDVLVGVDEAELLALVRSLREPMAQTVILGVVMATALTSTFAWTAMRRVGQLARAARRIQDNDLESPVPQEGPHEVRQLAGAMEDMRLALQQSREALLLANRDLALQVAASSASLSEVTGDLQAMQRVVAHLAGESAGGLPAVVEELLRLQWVDGALIALATAQGRLSVAASAAIPPGAAVRVLELLEEGRPEHALPAEIAIQDTRREDARTLRAWRIGGLAAQPMFTPDGIAGVICVTSNGPLAVTPQRRELLRSVAHEIAATLERSELADEVQENRQLAEAVLREMSDGVIVLDQEEVCRVCNPAAARLLSRSRADIIGRPAQEWLPLPASAIATLRERAAAGTGTAMPLIATTDDRRLAITAGPLRDPDPERAGMIVLIRDLSAEAEAERLKRDFVAMVGHELRTPLTMIRTTVDLLQEQDAGTLNPTQQRVVHVLNQNTERLMMLITDLLDMSALDSGRMPVNATAIDLGGVVEAAAEIARPAVEAHRHTLHVDAPRGIKVWADAARIGQVLANLLSNAIKYTPPGGTIELRIDEGDPYVTVSVTDSGIGIAPVEQAALFEKFYRASGGRRTTGGTGLGLAIARSIVELHGGTIRCESDGEHGATFAFTVPRRPL